MMILISLLDAREVGQCVRSTSGAFRFIYVTFYVRVVDPWRSELMYCTTRTTFSRTSNVEVDLDGRKAKEGC